MPKTHETGTARTQGSERLEKARTMLTDILLFQCSAINEMTISGEQLGSAMTAE